MFLICCVLASPGAEPPGDAAETATVSKSRKFIDQLAKGEYEDAEADFDETMRKVLPPDKLKSEWDQLVKQLGKFKEQGASRVDKTEKHTTVFVLCTFEKLKLETKIVWTKEGKLTGLFFAPPKEEYKAPAYVKPDSFREELVSFGPEEWTLPGTLSTPKEGGPFPALVLVHGSGPQDRDETIGPNKPFRDLASGLSSRGIAVLRYDKRTLVHGKKLAKSITTKEELIDDVAAAVEMLRHRKEIDAKGIFVLGHSLGGMMVPRIGKADPAIAGFVIMAGLTRPLEDTILEQITYLLTKDGEPDEEGKERLARLKKEVARVKDPKLAADTPSDELPLHIPASYWLDLRGYEPAVAAKDLKQPLLILQGERDYQVTMKDLAAFENSLSGRKNVTLKSYPKLNHLMMPGEGKSTPEEMMRSGHVDPEVVEDIAAWIKKQ
jgi:dienelactone hydrolase